MKSWTPPTTEMVEKVLASVKKETDRQYFFSRLKNPLWIEPLRDRGYFGSPPGMKRLPDGYVQFPGWAELDYLVAVAGASPELVVDILLALPATDNPRVYDGVLTAALNLSGGMSAELLPKLIEYVDLNNQVFAHRYQDLLVHWVAEGNIKQSLEIAKQLVRFREDPRADYKERLRKKEPESPGSILEPSTKLGDWEYQQFLKVGVGALIDQAPFDAADLLIDAAHEMIELGMHKSDRDAGREEDYSEIWCRRLNQHDADYEDARKCLVITLTDACRRVYDSRDESIPELDELLRSRRFLLFKRLRQYLYSLHPCELTRPWIRELVLDYPSYAVSEYHYEYQLMVKEASEKLGALFLAADEVEAIFQAIVAGPSKEEYRSWLGEEYTEEAYERRKKHFHRMQLRPFLVLLSDEHRRYYDCLEEDLQAKAVSDDDYSPYGLTTSGWVGHQSPISGEEMRDLQDEELLAYINKWNSERWDTQEGLVEINISALADQFSEVFRDTIITHDDRMRFWVSHVGQIDRPVYVTSIIKVFQDLLKVGEPKYFSVCFELCEWVLTKPDAERIDGRSDLSANSAENPDWGASRRAVVDLIDALVEKDSDTPVVYRDALAALIETLVTQFDSRLDQGFQVNRKQRDLISEAVNSTRGRAIGALVRYGFWVRKQVSDDPLEELPRILSLRLSDDVEFKLTPPEQALLGMHFGNLVHLVRNWSLSVQSQLFPREDEERWRQAFLAYLRYNRPSRPAFELLYPEFDFALENLRLLSGLEGDEGKAVDRLGQHIVTYYLWDVFPLFGEDSFLQRYYEKTSDDRDRWAQLFDHVGRSLAQSSDLGTEILDRVFDYFEWRVDHAEPTELREFTFWLKAESLDPVWRLNSYLRILDHGPGSSVGMSSEIKSLNRLLPDHSELVVQCFARLTDGLSQDNQLYISVEEARPILSLGLNAESSDVVEAAARARENLLRIGRFDFLDID